MSTADLLGQLRAANPVPKSDQVDVDDIALLAAIDERYVALSNVAHPAEPPPSFDDHPTVDYLRQRPDESGASAEPRGWSGVVIAVAASILVVVGVVVVADGNSGDVVTDPISSATTPDATPSPTTPDATPSPTTPDPLPYRWSRVPHDEAVFRGARGQWMKSVTVGGPGLVAVGSVGNDGDAVAAVWTSVGGITWSRVPHDEAVFGGARGQWMSSVTVGGPGLVAVGSDGRFSDFDYEATAGEWRWWGDEDGAAAVWTSVDGLTWSRVPHDEAVFGADADQEMNSVVIGGPGLVAVGSVGSGDNAVAAVWTSVDGITWSRVPHDEAVFGGARGQWMHSVTVGGPGFVAVGVDGPESDGGDWGCCQRAAVWTSVDGITWSRVALDEPVSGEQVMNSVVAAGSGLVAVGYEYQGDDVPTGPALDAAVWTSADGLAWSRVPHDRTVFGGTGNQRMNSVTVTGAGLVAVGADGGFYYTRPDAVVWTSVDGVTWSRVPHDEAVFGGAQMNSVTVADAGLVAVGDESLESKSLAEGQEAFEAGDSVFVWVAEPKD